MDSNFQTIKTRQERRLRWIVLNTPKTKNAFDRQQWLDVLQALTDAEDDESVGCVALRGAGGNFSAGYDFPAAMEKMKDRSVESIRDHIAPGNEVCWKIWNFKKPMIAAIEGYCLGGAFEMAMACDFVVAERSSSFGEPEARIGTAAPFLITPWVAGLRYAKELLLTGRIVSAARAEHMGLVNELCEPGKIEDCVHAWASQLTAFSGGSWHRNKMSVNRAYEIMGFNTAIALGEDAFVETVLSTDKFKKELAERIARDGFSSALGWVKNRFG
ncbi:MAG: enoyl-CoA hydratase/isomerase family protein [Bryobacteraceae bacterium]